MGRRGAGTPSCIVRSIQSRLAVLLAEQGTKKEALSILERALMADPVNEALCRRAMTLDDAPGQRSAALARFRSLEITLEKELAIEPDP